MKLTKPQKKVIRIMQENPGIKCSGAIGKQIYNPLSTYRQRIAWVTGTLYALFHEGYVRWRVDQDGIETWHLTAKGRSYDTH